MERLLQGRGNNYGGATTGKEVLTLGEIALWFCLLVSKITTLTNDSWFTIRNVGKKMQEDRTQWERVGVWCCVYSRPIGKCHTHVCESIDVC